MNISTGFYTEEELIKALSAGNREVFYEFFLLDQNKKTIAKLPVRDGKISYDSSNDVMRTFTGATKKTDLFNLESTDYYLRPYMCLRYNGDVVRWPLGLFILNPSENHQNNISDINIIGYDPGKIALDDKADSREYAPTGSIYTSLAAQVAGTMYSNINIEPCLKESLNPLEWEIGTEKVTIINDLLQPISYNPMHFDEFGICQILPYVSDDEREIERIYQEGDDSIIIDGLKVETNKFEVPNKIVRYVENPDAAYLISSYINDDPDSPYSTVNRGRVIVDTDAVADIASQADLDSYVRKIAGERIQAVETLEIETLNMPGHGFRNCLLISINTYGIEDKYIETAWEMDLREGGTMKHYLKKAVTV